MCMCDSGWLCSATRATTWWAREWVAALDTASISSSGTAMVVEKGCDMAIHFLLPTVRLCWRWAKTHTSKWKHAQIANSNVHICAIEMCSNWYCSNLDSSSISLYRWVFMLYSAHTFHYFCSANTHNSGSWPGEGEGGGGAAWGVL